MTNFEIAEHLRNLAELSTAAGENPFKARAYRKAATVIEEHPTPVIELTNPQQLPGVGKGVAKKIKELQETGTTTRAEKLKVDVQYDSGFSELLQVPGIGPVKARNLMNNGIRTLNQLRTALSSGTFRDDRIKLGLEVLEEVGLERRPWQEAYDAAKPLLNELRFCFLDSKFSPAGSLRRRKKTVGDIDIVCATEDARDEIRAFVRSRMKIVLADGTTKISGAYNGLQLQVRFFEPQHWGAAMLYFTGSKGFNVELRKIAISKGLSLNEYALTREGVPIAGATEEEVLQALGFRYIPPLMRTDGFHLKNPQYIPTSAPQELEL